MAVDTMQKRGSAGGMGALPLLLPFTDGETTQAGREQTMALYRVGDTGPPPPGGNIYMKPGRVFGPP